MATKRTTTKGAAKAAPASKLPRKLTSAEDYARVANDQREWLERIACQIERCEPLSSMDRPFAAEALRMAARQIPDKQHRKPGQAAKLDAREVAIHYACMVHGQGIRKSVAIAQLAEGNDVTIEAIRAIVNQYGDAALRQIPKNPKLFPE